MQHLHTTLRRIRWWILAATAAFLAAAGTVLFLVPIDETVRATGTIAAERDVFLFAPAESAIQELSADDGQDVRAGEVILVLDAHDLENQREGLQAELQEAGAQSTLKQRALERINKLPLPKEFWHAQTELAAAEQKARFAAEEHERSRLLYESKLASVSELAAQRLADELAQGELANARDQVRVVQAGLEQSITQEALADFNAAGARAERLKTDLGVCEREIARRRLRAPVDGRVTLVLKRRAGERVAKGDELVHLSCGPANRARLSVGEPHLHRIRVGQAVRLSTPVFSPLRYGYLDGHIEKVALEPTPGPGGDPAPEGRYRVDARIDKTPLPLVLGARLDAEIILRRVPLWRLFLPAAAGQP